MPIYCGHATKRHVTLTDDDRALYDAPRPGGQRKLDGAQEATLIALACTTPPAGHAVWTMQLLADRLVTLEVVDTLSDETVRRTLKKYAQTVAKAAVVLPEDNHRLPLPDGRRSRALRRAHRSAPAPRLSR